MRNAILPVGRFVKSKNLTFATVVSMWQILGFVVAVGMAFGYIWLVKVDPQEQIEDLNSRGEEISASWPDICKNVLDKYEPQANSQTDLVVQNESIPNSWGDSGHSSDFFMLPKTAIDQDTLNAGITVAVLQSLLKDVQFNLVKKGVHTGREFGQEFFEIDPNQELSANRNGRDDPDTQAKLALEFKKSADISQTTIRPGENVANSTQAKLALESKKSADISQTTIRPGENVANSIGIENDCPQLEWRIPVSGRIVRDTSEQSALYRLQPATAKTRWAELTVSGKEAYLYIVNEGPSDRQKWAGRVGVALPVLVFLILSVHVMKLLYRYLDGLSEFSRRIVFVLHDIRENTERIRSNKHADEQIHELVDSTNQLIEDGRRIANIQQEPKLRVDLYHALLAARENVAVEIDCPHGLIVRVPDRSFRSAITNLLYNAEEHGSSDGTSRIELVVSVRRSGRWFGKRLEAVIVITDDGKGVKREVGRSESIEKAIRRIQRSQDFDEQRGLGLLSVLYVIQECGGQFTLTKRCDGKSGTVVEIVLPVEQH